MRHWTQPYRLPLVEVALVLPRARYYLPSYYLVIYWRSHNTLHSINHVDLCQIVLYLFISSILLKHIVIVPYFQISFSWIVHADVGVRWLRRVVIAILVDLVQILLTPVILTRVLLVNSISRTHFVLNLLHRLLPLHVVYLWQLQGRLAWIPYKSHLTYVLSTKMRLVPLLYYLPSPSVNTLNYPDCPRICSWVTIAQLFFRCFPIHYLRLLSLDWSSNLSFVLTINVLKLGVILLHFSTTLPRHFPVLLLRILLTPSTVCRHYRH
jgi:hypothetical protein